ncbi:IMPACT family protein [Natronospora cellulosivora (SeqCode)]
MNEKYHVPAQNIRLLNKVKDSKFYGDIKYVRTEKEAQAFLNMIKEEFNDASHNVSAYRIQSDNIFIEKYDDDGEPASSSGPPILQAITGASLTNTIIVVTRYFGGTKLGIGGLIRAYGETARLLIREAGLRILSLHNVVKVRVDYQLIGTVLGQIESFNLELLKTEYSNEGVDIFFLIKSNRYSHVEKVLVEKTANNIKMRKIENKYI